MIKLPPSGIWPKCLASARFNVDEPKEPLTVHAEEGITAAWLAQKLIEQHSDGKDISESLSTHINSTHVNGTLITQDMASFVKGYVELVTSRGGIVHVEKSVQINQYIRGYIDSYSIVDDTLYVDDFKYGYGIIEPFENTQLILYAGGVLMSMDNPKSIKTVSLGIYQPRATHVMGRYRTWVLSLDEFRPYFGALLKKSEEAQNPESLATPGSHCRYCLSRGKCQALSENLYAAYELLDSQYKHTPTEEEVSLEWDFIQNMSKILEARKSSLEAEITSKLNSGGVIPGLMLAPRLGKSRIRNDIEPLDIEMITGVDVYDRVLKTPAQLKRDGVKKDIIDQISIRDVNGHAIQKTPHGYFNTQEKINE